MNSVMIYICLIKELTLTMGKTGLVGFIFNKEMGWCYAEPLLFHALYYLPHSFPVLFLLASKSMFIVLLNKRKG